MKNATTTTHDIAQVFNLNAEFLAAAKQKIWEAEDVVAALVRLTQESQLLRRSALNMVLRTVNLEIKKYSAHLGIDRPYRIVFMDIELAAYRTSDFKTSNDLCDYIQDVLIAIVEEHTKEDSSLMLGIYHKVASQMI